MARTWTGVLVAIAVSAVSGCGGGSSGSGADTASVVPRSAFFYGEAVVDPEGDQEEAVRSIVGKFPGEGPPEQRLEKLVSDALRDSDEGKLDYEKDVKPWLGDKVAFFASAPPAGAKASGDMPVAIVIATDDEDKARDAIEKSGGSDLKERSYKDVDYLRDPDEDGELNAGGVVDGFAVIGTEAAFKAAVDASKDESLAESDRFKTATENAEDERVGLFYSDIQGLISAVGQQQQAGIPLAALSGPIQQLFGDKPVVATARAEDDGVVLDSSMSAQGGLLANLFGKGTELVGELPADSWVAVGQPDIGKYLTELVNMVAGLAGGREQLAAQVRRQTGLDLDRDILGWMGDLAIFVRGVDRSSIGGGVVIESTDPSASRRALSGLQRLIAEDGDANVRAIADGFEARDEDTPAGVYFLQKDDRVVIAYGKESADAALEGNEPLSGKPEFKAAQDKLGDGFESSMYVLMDPIVEVARNFGAKEEELAKAEPYLKVFDVIAGGTKKDGDRLQSRVRIGLN